MYGEVISLIKHTFKSLRQRWLLILFAVTASFLAFAFVVLIGEAARFAALFCFRSASDAQIAVLWDRLDFAVAVMSLASKLLISLPITAGFKRIMWLAVCGKRASESDIFWCYSLRRLFKYVLLKALVLIRTFLWSAAFIVPSLFADILVGRYFDGFISISVKCVLLGAGICAALIKLVSYSAVDFIFFEDTDMKPLEIIKKSTALFGLRGRAVDLVLLLYIVFIPIFLLSAAIIPLFVTVPLLTACVALLTVREPV